MTPTKLTCEKGFTSEKFLHLKKCDLKKNWSENVSASWNEFAYQKSTSEYKWGKMEVFLYLIKREVDFHFKNIEVDMNFISLS